jgi:hypothetical protein
MIDIGFAEIIELLVLILIFYVHKAVSFVYHMLLTSAGILEHFATEKAQITKLNTFCNICEQTLERDNTINIEDEERVLNTHVVEAFLDSFAFLVAEKTDSQRFQGGLRR